MNINKLNTLVHNDWAYVEIRRGAYGLAQAGVLAHEQLMKRFNEAGCFEAPTMPGLWNHK